MPAAQNGIRTGACRFITIRTNPYIREAQRGEICKLEVKRTARDCAWVKEPLKVEEGEYSLRANEECLEMALVI